MGLDAIIAEVNIEVGICSGARAGEPDLVVEDTTMLEDGTVPIVVTGVEDDICVEPVDDINVIDEPTFEIEVADVEDGAAVLDSLKVEEDSELVDGNDVVVDSAEVMEDSVVTDDGGGEF